MSKANQPHVEQHNASPAAARDQRRHTADIPTLENNLLEAIAQRRLADAISQSPQQQAHRAANAAIHHSPYMVAQRQQLRGMFGQAAQLKGGPEDEELLQGKFAPVQRQGGPEEEELLQGKFASVQREEAEPERRPPENNTGLPDNLKSGIESLSGMSMDNVKVHYNSAQPAQLNALAYAQGTDIHVAPGQEQHLPHEAWHVVQQAQGRVKPTMEMKDGVSINDDAGLEQEADVMGTKGAKGVAGAVLQTTRPDPVPRGRAFAEAGPKVEEQFVGERHQPKYGYRASRLKSKSRDQHDAHGDGHPLTNEPSSEKITRNGSVAQLMAVIQLVGWDTLRRAGSWVISLRGLKTIGAGAAALFALGMTITEIVQLGMGTSGFSPGNAITIVFGDVAAAALVYMQTKKIRTETGRGRLDVVLEHLQNARDEAEDPVVPEDVRVNIAEAIEGIRVEQEQENQVLEL